MKFMGFAHMESGDLRWFMRRNNISKKELADAAGITERMLDDFLSLQVIPDKAALILLEGLKKLTK